MSDGSGPISVRDSLSGAMAELAAPEPPVAAAPEPGAPEPAPAEPQAAAPGGDETATNRDDKGRFAPKETAAAASAEAPPAAEKIETAAPADKEPQTEAIQPPPSLPAAVKAQWSELKPEVQQAFHKLEETVQTSKAEWGRKGERLNRYDEIMAPRAEKFALQGIDEFTAIKTLLAAQDFLERDPLGGIQHLARSYGVNLSQAGQQQNGQPPAGEAPRSPTLDPAIEAALKPLLEQVQTLHTEITSSKQTSEAAKLAEAQAEVAAFAAKPENMYFENVRSDVAKRIETGAATSLADAYEQAIWASAEIRPLLIRAQAQAEAKKAADEAARQKAAQSRQASGSVTGAPTGGAQAQSSGSTGNVRDDLRAAMKEIGAHV